MRPSIPSLAFVPLLALATAPAAAQSPRPGDESFEQTWHSGVAELNRYEVETSRYGEQRRSTVVAVFVTERFDPDRLVKDEDGEGPSVAVLKMNRIERFVTGIYDYSIMQSTFTPYGSEGPAPSLEVTVSVQDWCGHVWLQLQRSDNKTNVLGHSYFEREGDERRVLPGGPDVLWEDGLWTRIRLDPRSLPTGELRIVPGAVHARLRHRPLRLHAAHAELREIPADAEHPARLVYALDYADRALHLEVASAWPHELLGWTEFAGEAGADRRVVTTAVRTATTRRAYWSEHDNDDLGLRAELALPESFGREASDR